MCGVANPHGLHMSFYQPQPDVVTATYVVPEHFQGYPGVAHGGIIAAMLDEVAGRVFMGGEPPRFMVTARISIRYRKPVPVGETLHLSGRIKRDDGRVGVSTSEIRDEKGQLLAEAEVVMANIPPEVVNGVNVGPEDWQVYPDEEKLQ